MQATKYFFFSLVDKSKSGYIIVLQGITAKDIREIMGKKVLIKPTDYVNGVKYKCGCVCGSDRKVPYQMLPQKCITHRSPIIGFWRK